MSLSCGLILGTSGLFLASVLVISRRERKREALILAYLENPEQSERDKIFMQLGVREKEKLSLISRQLEARDRTIREQKLHIQEYEEYIEAWAHEIKTPLSLMTFLLDNRRDELPPCVYHRLEYIRSRMHEDIQRMLYYARLKAEKTDYLFEKVSLRECCEDVLEEYQALLQEHKFCVSNQVQDINAVTDRKGISFILSQIISNSIKYGKKKEEVPRILLYTQTEDTAGKLILGIRDNGIGVKPYDIPFLFQKGFTGDLGEGRRNATGMGLYLAEQMAMDMKLKIGVKEEYKEGFEILITFPSAENDH